MQVFSSKRAFGWFHLWGWGITACFLFLLCVVFTVDIAHAAPASHIGGPDNFGYTFSDSGEDDGPAYRWEEITTTGTLITGWSNLTGGFAGPIPIGFDFKFYGATYTELYVGTDGYVSFGQGYNYVPHYTPPDDSEPNNAIFSLNYDTILLDYGIASAVYYQTFHNPNRLVIEYVNLYEWDDSNPQTVQMILYANGDILMQYKQLPADLGYNYNYLPGIENVTGRDGLAYHQSLRSGLAVLYRYPPPLLLSPSTQKSFGKAGVTSMRRIRLFNHTGQSDSFALSVIGENQWPVSLSLTQTLVLTESESIVVEIHISVPLTATQGALDTVTVKAGSMHNPSLEVTATITTQVTSGHIGYALFPASRQVAVIDTSAYQVLDYMDLARYLCDAPNRLAITPDGKQLYVACDSVVLVVDTNSQAVVATIQQGNGLGIAFSNDGQWALMNELHSRWLYGRPPWPTYGVVVAKNTRTYESVILLAEIDLYLNQIITHPAAPIAYAGFGNSILTIDTSELTRRDISAIYTQETPLIKLKIAPSGWWILANTAQKLLAIHTVRPLVRTVLNTNVRDMTFLHNGAAAFAVSGNSLITLDGDTFKIIGNHPLDRTPTSLVASCNDTELWINDAHTPTIAVLDASNYQTIHTINLQDTASQLILCPQLTNSNIPLLAWPAPPEVQGDRGETVTAALNITNLSTQPLTVSLTFTGSWPITLPVSTLVAPAKSRVSTPISITIPNDVPWFAHDSITITATNTATPAVVSTAVITATAYALPVLAATPSGLTSVQIMNEIVTKTLTISNTRGITMPVTLSDGESFRTTEDNDDDSGTGRPDDDLNSIVCHSVEFTIFVTTSPISANGNTLTISSDFTIGSGAISVNGVAVGFLSNDLQTTVPIPAGLVVPGVNRIRITPRICIFINWGELSVMPVDTGWMSETPDTFSIVTGSHQDVTVTFDSTGLRPGNYAGVIWAAPTAPLQPHRAISTTMTVLPMANLGSVTGRVLNSLSMNAVTVSLEQVESVHPDVTGNYTLWADAGTYILTAVAAGYSPYKSSVRVTAGSNIVEDIQFVRLPQSHLYRYPLILKSD